MPPVAKPTVPRAQRPCVVRLCDTVAVRDDLLSPAAVSVRQTQALRESQVEAALRGSTETEGG